MKPSRIVVDASALVDGLDAGRPERVETLRFLRGNYSIEAPRLVESELGNVIHRKSPAVFGRDVGARAEILELALAGITRGEGDAASRARCGMLVETLGVTFDDAEYLELAAREPDTLLITQDRRLRTASAQASLEACDLDEAGLRIARGTL